MNLKNHRIKDLRNIKTLRLFVKFWSILYFYVFLYFIQITYTKFIDIAMKRSNIIGVKKRFLLCVLIINFSIGIFTFNTILNDNPSYVEDNSVASYSKIFYEDTEGNATDIFVDGDLAYLADGISGLAIINISDPLEPQIIGYEDTDGYANGVFIYGNIAYIADGHSGLAIINITNPLEPQIIDYEDTNGYANGVFIDGNFAFIADGSSGLAIINITNPLEPQIINYEDTDGYANGVFIDGNYAYIADGPSGLAIIDITNPIEPQIISYKDTDGYANNVFIDGDFAYIADGVSGITAINITYPAIPAYISSMLLNSSAVDISIDGDYAYLSCNTTGLAIINITDPFIFGVPSYEYIDTHIVQGLCIDGNYAFIAGADSGIIITEISRIISPIDIYSETVLSNLEHVRVKGNFAYVTRMDGSLFTFDITNPTAPINLGYTLLSGSLSRLDIEGDYLYVAAGGGTNPLYGGLCIVDISNPKSPVLRARIKGNNSAIAISVDGDLAYVGDGNAGLLIVNISNPMNPNILSHMDTNGIAYDVISYDNYVYIADGGGGLAVIDVSRPDAPINITQLDWGRFALSLSISGHYLYIGCGSYLAVFDISIPYDPILLKSIYTGSSNYDIKISGNYIYISGRDDGILIINIKDPRNPIIESQKAIDSDPMGIDINGNYAYLTGFSTGLFEVIQIKERTDREVPVLLEIASDLVVDFGYTEGEFTWIADDSHPYNYTIILENIGLIEGPLVWQSHTPIIFYIEEGYSIGDYFFIINITDEYNHFITDRVKLTVRDPDNPIIQDSPDDLIICYDYQNLDLIWNVSDLYPDLYYIYHDDLGLMEGPKSWDSEFPISYLVPEGLNIGEHIFYINLTDEYDNSIVDNVSIMIEDWIDPIFIDKPSDLTINLGYTGVSLSWKLIDMTPDLYTLELLGTGTLIYPSNWNNNTKITYFIQDGLPLGNYTFVVHFEDKFGNIASDEVNIIVKSRPIERGISFGFYFIGFLLIGLISIVIVQKRRMMINSQ